MGELAVDGRLQQSADGSTERAVPLSFFELVDLTVKLNTRLDTLWHRVIYAHAAIVAVMVFFSATQNPYVLQRLLVLFVYTMNSVVTHLAFRDAYKGLLAATEDLKQYPDRGSQIAGWAQNRHFGHSALARGLFLATMWVVIAYLILFRLLMQA